MTETSGWAEFDEQAGEDVDLQSVLDTLQSISVNQSKLATSVEGQAKRQDQLESVIKELTEVVESLVKQKRQRRPRRYRFEALDDEGKLALWVELAGFVDYLNGIFGTSAKHRKAKWRIPDWWWKQPIVVYELLALKASHDEAFTSTTPEAPTTEMIAWLDRWFWPCMTRIFNEEWGLRVQPVPGEAESKFSLVEATNSRHEFDAFLVSEFGSTAPKERDLAEQSA